MKEHISSYCKWNFNSTICNSNQKSNNKTSQCEYKNYWTCTKSDIINTHTKLYLVHNLCQLDSIK